MSVESSSPSFPPEICIQISQALGQPSHPSAYCLASGHAHALAQLCLTSRAFHALTKPILYSRVFITPESLESFTNTVAPALMNTPSILTDSGLVIGVLVKSLAFANFVFPTRSQAQQIGSMVYALRHTVIRLFLGVSLSPSVSSDRAGHDVIYNALQSLSAIQELCIGYNWHDWRYLPTWKTLQRMAIVMFTFSPRLLVKLSELKSLKLCIMAFPFTVDARSVGLDLQQDILRCWSGRGPVPLELVLAVNRMEDAWFISFLEQIEKNPLESLEEAVVKGKLTVMELPRVGDDPDVSKRWRAKGAWFSSAALDGSIWFRQKESWEVYCRNRSDGI
ncbi:hypothetical protein FRB97_006179 [Tulasnella sp. 331]|nr:hypothetical protein FRB97_006179 [Tulasnella sp. 331]